MTQSPKGVPTLLQQATKLSTPRLEGLYLQIYALLNERDLKAAAKAKKKQPPKPASAGQPER